jgi:hypothetical protein
MGQAVEGRRPQTYTGEPSVYSFRMPRAHTTEEVRTKFLDHVTMMVRYWETVQTGGDKTTRERLEGLAFSMLVMLDGASSGLPKFIVQPDPHPSDRQYHIDQGENYFPEDDCDIAGGLHEEWSRT